MAGIGSQTGRQFWRRYIFAYQNEIRAWAQGIARIVKISLGNIFTLTSDSLGASTMSHELVAQVDGPIQSVTAKLVSQRRPLRPN